MRGKDRSRGFKAKSFFKSSCRGTTLVEVAVSFALIGFFLLAATTALSAALDTFYRMQATTHAITVSATVLDKIEGEVSAAMADNGLLHVGIVSGTGNSGISFYTGDGSPVYISSAAAEDGRKYFAMHYYPVMGESSTDGGEASDWMFDRRMYQGFWVSELEFALESVSPCVVVRASLVLENQNMSYREERYIQCGNFFAPEHLENVREGAVISPVSPEEDS